MLRTAVDKLYPDGGDAIIDKLIQVVGEGSEKVFYHLGVNAKNREKFIKSLKADAGLSAATFLGTLKTELVSPKRRKSQAPQPGEKIVADAGSPAADAKLAKDYKAASGKDPQKAYNIKKQARAAGIDVSVWH